MNIEFDKKVFATFIACLFCAWICGGAVGAQVAQGGNFRLEQTVIAAGGGNSVSADNNFAVVGTTGQALAGARSANQTASVRSGFWSSALAPTAASVAVSGRITTADGRGIRGVRVLMTDANGSTRQTASGAFGYYRFDDVAAGGAYIFQVFAKRYVFAEAMQVRNINGETDDINFVADR